MTTINRPRLRACRGGWPLRAALPCLVAVASQAAHAGLVLSPATIENVWTGSLEVTITGLPAAGQAVALEEFLDSDADGAIGPGDALIRRVVVTDGTTEIIGGVTNLNVPGDEDQTPNHAIQTRLRAHLGEIVRFVSGQHLLRATAADGPAFTPMVAALAVTQHSYGGSGISGQVIEAGTRQPQPEAFVVVLELLNGGSEVLHVLRADGEGSFSIHVPAGIYLLVGVKPGFVCDIGAQSPIAVARGAFTTGQAVEVTPGERTISGVVRDAIGGPGLGGVPVVGSAMESSFVSFAFADAAGNYTLDATAEPWGLVVEEAQAAQAGFVNPEFVERGMGSVTGVVLGLADATSLIHGTVMTPQGDPVPNALLQAETAGLPELSSAAWSDAEGDFTFGATIGTWRLIPAVPGYLIEQQTVVVSMRNSAVSQSIIAHPITAHLRGQVRDNNGTPLPGIEIQACVPNPDGTEIAVCSVTACDGDGIFDLGVYGGGGSRTQAWQITLWSPDSGTQDYISTVQTFEVVDGQDIDGIDYVAHIVTAHLRGHVLDELDHPIGNIPIGASESTLALKAGSGVQEDGSFDLAVTGGTWGLGLGNLLGLGLIPQSYSVVVTSGIDQEGLVFRAVHADGSVQGSVLSTTGAPIAGLAVIGTTLSEGASFVSVGCTDALGQYSVPVFSGPWEIDVSAEDLAAHGFGAVPSQPVFLSGGVVEVNFVASPLLAADLNGDGVVNGADLGLLLAGWGGRGPGDLSGDGHVDGADLGMLLAAWS